MINVFTPRPDSFDDRWKAAPRPDSCTLAQNCFLIPES